MGSMFIIWIDMWSEILIYPSALLILLHKYYFVSSLKRKVNCKVPILQMILDKILLKIFMKKNRMKISFLWLVFCYQRKLKLSINTDFISSLYTFVWFFFLFLNKKKINVILLSNYPKRFGLRVITQHENMFPFMIRFQ